MERGSHSVNVCYVEVDPRRHCTIQRFLPAQTVLTRSKVNLMVETPFKHLLTICLLMACSGVGARCSWGDISSQRVMESSPHKVPITLHQTYLCDSARDDANEVGPVTYPCSISVSHLWSTLIRRFQDKLLKYIFSSLSSYRHSFIAAAAAAAEPHSIRPALLTHFSFD